MNLDYLENIYKIIYSENFKNSIYNNIFIINLEIENLIINFINDFKIYNQISISEFIYDNFNIYKLSKIDLINSNNIYIYNYLFRIITPLIEEYYLFPNYILYLKNIYYSQLTPLSKYECTNIENDKIITLNSNAFEFIVIINLGSDFNIKIDNNTHILENNKIIIFSNRNNFNITNYKDQNILILNYSILNGYNRFDYNKHPNQKLTKLINL